jgi:hypothetical protein
MPIKSPKSSKRSHEHDNEEYKVGYGKPPIHTRFKLGQCGNPRGRPAGRPGMAAVLQAVLDQKVPVIEGGKAKKMSKREMMLVTAVNRAIKGDAKALMAVINIMSRVGSKDLEPVQERVEEAPEDAAILELFLKRSRS